MSQNQDDRQGQRDWLDDQDILNHLEMVSAMMLHGAHPWQVAEGLEEAIPGYSLDDALRDIERVKLLWQKQAKEAGELPGEAGLAQVREVQLRAWEQYEETKNPAHLKVVLEAEKDKVAYQQTLFDEPEPLVETIPGQEEAKRGKTYFFEYLATTFPYIEDVYKLMAQGWDWRKAILIVYEATPKAKRRPKTYKELAVDYLNLTGPRVFSDWRAKGSPIDETAVWLARERAIAPGPDRLAEVIEAAYRTAGIIGREGLGDRKMIFDMAGLTPVSDNGKPKDPPDADIKAVTEEMSNAELDQFIANLVVAQSIQAANSQPAFPGDNSATDGEGGSAESGE